MAVAIYNKPRAEDLTLADVIVESLDIGGGADKLGLTHDGTDAYFKTDDGGFIFQTDEATNTDTAVTIKPKGSGMGSQLYLNDDDVWELNITVDADEAWIQTRARALDLQRDVVQDVDFWSAIASGNPSINIFGWNTAGSDLESTELTMDDTNDEFLVQTANSANHEGITVGLLEANQMFRVRGSDGNVKFSASSAGAVTVSGTTTLSGELDMNSQNIDNIKTATFIAEVTATPSSAFTVDWTAAQKQRVTITGTTLDITFTNPDGPCNLTLVVVQGDGSDTIDWTNEADIVWPGGTAPTLSTGSGDVDIVSFYFDGTSYHGVSNLDFS